MGGPHRAVAAERHRHAQHRQRDDGRPAEELAARAGVQLPTLSPVIIATHRLRPRRRARRLPHPAPNAAAHAGLGRRAAGRRRDRRRRGRRRWPVPIERQPGGGDVPRELARRAVGRTRACSRSAAPAARSRSPLRPAGTSTNRTCGAASPRSSDRCRSDTDGTTRMDLRLEAGQVAVEAFSGPVARRGPEHDGAPQRRGRHRGHGHQQHRRAHRRRRRVRRRPGEVPRRPRARRAGRLGVERPTGHQPVVRPRQPGLGNRRDGHVRRRRSDGGARADGSAAQSGSSATPPSRPSPAGASWPRSGSGASPRRGGSCSPPATHAWPDGRPSSHPRSASATSTRRGPSSAR